MAVPIPENLVVTAVQGRVATIRLDRPRARNALNLALMHALWDAVLAADADPGVDAVVLTGSDPAFCAGVDLKEVTGETPPSAAARGPGEGPERGADGLYRFLPVTGKPVIGAVNGPAVTGGLELALQCTFLVASERASFADTHARLGVMPGGGATVLLAQAIGLRRAIEMSLTGHALDAAGALRLGLVNHVVPHEELLPTAQGLAAAVAGTDTDAVHRLLRHYRALAGVATLEQAHLLEGVLAETWRPGTSRIRTRARVSE